MSGLAAIIHWNEPVVDAESVERMLDRMPHRATDGRAVLAGPHCALGFALHATTARERAAVQPLHDVQRGLWIVADARLDNRGELAELLGGGSRRDLSDPELLLLGYDRWGTALAERLVGDFTFVIWDAKSQELYAVRDPIGVRPLFYHRRPDRLVFASEAEPILFVDGVGREIDEQTVLGYLQTCYRRRGTFFRDVARVTPGHYLFGRRGVAHEVRYWQLPREERRARRREEYEEEFRRLFHLAVEVRLDADRPLIAQHSGGMDSPSIVCMADRIYRDGDATRPRVRLVSAVYPGLDCDESPYIDAVARATRFASERYDATAWDTAEEDAFHVAHPWRAAPAGISNGWRRLALRDGARVILVGTGGDELFQQTGAFADLAARGRWLALLRELHRVCDGSFQWQAYHLRRAFRSAAPDALRWIYRQAVPRRPERPPGWLGPQLQGIWASVCAQAPPMPRWASHAQRYTWGQLTSPHLDWTVTDLDGYRAARYGIEYRYPFFDARLVRFVLGMPSELLLPAGAWKGFLRRAMAEIVPAEVVQRRSQTTFESAVALHLRQELERYRTTLTDGVWYSAAYVERHAAQELLERLSSRPAVGQEWLSWMTAWNIVMLEVWLRELAEVRWTARPRAPSLPATARSGVWSSTGPGARGGVPVRPGSLPHH